MTNQARVKTIAFGGRSNANKIQAVGGVKGANVYQMETVRAFTTQAIKYNATLTNSALKEYNPYYVLYRAGSAAVNVRDALRQNDDGVALQFKYEEADCRLYFTPAMTVDVSAIWKAAADAQWSDPSRCIGNGGYYSPPYAKRTDQIKTTSLSMADTKVHGAQALDRSEALNRFEALKNTFSLETEYQHNADGFMQP